MPALTDQTRVTIIGISLATLILFDVVICVHLGWRIADWSAPLLPLGVLAAIALIYGWSGRSAGLARTASWLFAWTLFSLAGVILSYMAGTSSGSLHDEALSRFDLALGFNWLNWFEYIEAHPALHTILSIGYASMIGQIVFSVVYFTWREFDYKNIDLMLNVIAGTLLTLLVFWSFPALGPSAGIVLSPDHASSIDLSQLKERNGILELIALRSGNFTEINLSHLKGIISFPSLHTVMTIVLTHIHYRTVFFIPILLLNGLMLMSIPVIGGHYLVDCIAGMIVASITIFLTHPIRNRRRPSPSMIRA